MTPLHYFGQALRQLLLQIPLGAARGVFLLSLLLLLAWILRLPRTQTTRPDGTGKLAENLKLWAALAILIQIAIYALL